MLISCSSLPRTIFLRIKWCSNYTTRIDELYSSKNTLVWLELRYFGSRLAGLHRCFTYPALATPPLSPALATPLLSPALATPPHPRHPVFCPSIPARSCWIPNPMLQSALQLYLSIPRFYPSAPLYSSYVADGVTDLSDPAVSPIPSLYSFLRRSFHL